MIHFDCNVKLNEYFQTEISSYLSSSALQCNKGVSQNALINFCRFLQHKNVLSFSEISYDVLAEYHCFVNESVHHYQYYESRVGKFFEYLLLQGIGRMGFPLFMNNRYYCNVPSISDFDNEQAKTIIDASQEEGSLDAESLFSLFDGFKTHLLEKGLSQNAAGSASYVLTILFLFLDRENLKYNHKVALSWLDYMRDHMADKRKATKYLRFLDLFDDFFNQGYADIGKRLRHIDNRYNLLPAWCRSKVDVFLCNLLKEGKRKSTIKAYRNTVSRFCAFIVTEHLSSFSDITPKFLKAFNSIDGFDPSTRNGDNSRIRKFLIHLELQRIIPFGIHYALPCTASTGEKIVKVADPADLEKIKEFCNKASTPIELRDAAILQIELATGIRASDMVALRKNNIDWTNREIITTQSKTRVEHRHYVGNTVLNAVFKYLKDGRNSKASNDYIFVSSFPPYGPLSPTICNHAMKRAGCSVADFHRLRRTYATDSVKAGATISETAELLGQSNNSSLHRYLELDEKRMRCCPLSLQETGLMLKGKYEHE